MSTESAEIDLEDILAPAPDPVALEMVEAADLAMDEQPWDPAWNKYEADLRVGLRSVKRQVMAAMQAGRKPKKVTVAWVLRKARRGRSQFYDTHGASKLGLCAYRARWSGLRLVVADKTAHSQAEPPSPRRTAP